MAVWQFRVIFLPERVLLSKYDVLPPAISQELAEDFSWWADVQPPDGFEEQIDLILPQMESWSKEMRMWGRKHGDDAYVIYEGEDHKKVQEICFRVDARSVARDLVRKICILARQLGCVLMTADYDILVPDESMVLATIHHSTAKQFVDDPVATLRKLGQPEIQKRFNYPMKDKENNPPRTDD
jgi:hypothetical protein